MTQLGDGVICEVWCKPLARLVKLSPSCKIPAAPSGDSRPMFFSKAYSAVFDIQEDMAGAVRQMQDEFGWSEADFTMMMSFSTTYALSLVHARLKPNDGAKLYFRLDQLVAKYAPAGRRPSPQMADLRMRAASAIADTGDAEEAAAACWDAAQEYAGMMTRDEFIRVGAKICGTIRTALQGRGLP